MISMRHGPAPAELQVVGTPSFETLYAQEFAYVWRILGKLGVPAREREDASQEVWLAVHKNLSTFDPARPLRPWLWGISLRVVQMRRRTWRRRQKPLTLVDDIGSLGPPDSGDSPERLMATAQERAALMRAIDELSLDARAVLWMHLEGTPMAVIASSLGIPETTGHARLKAARTDLMAAQARARAKERRTSGLPAVVPLLDVEHVLRTVRGDLPTPDDQARVWSKVTERLSTAAAVAVGGGVGAVAGKAAASALWRAATHAGAAALGAGAALGYVALRPPSAPPMREVPVAVAEAPREPATKAEPSARPATVAPTVTVTRVVTVETSTPIHTAAASPASAVAPAHVGPNEADVLQRARTALARRDYDAAHAALDDYARQFPNGQLGASAATLRKQVRDGQGTPDGGAPHRLF